MQLLLYFLIRIVCSAIRSAFEQLSRASDVNFQLKLAKKNEKVSEYDQDMAQSHTADNPQHHEEEAQNTGSHKTPRRQLKYS